MREIKKRERESMKLTNNGRERGNVREGEGDE